MKRSAIADRGLEARLAEILAAFASVDDATDYELSEMLPHSLVNVERARRVLSKRGDLEVTGERRLNHTVRRLKR